MTSIPVNNAKSVLMDFVNKAPGKTQKNGETGSFTDVLNKQTKESDASQKTDDVACGTQAKIMKNAKAQVSKSKAESAEPEKAVEEFAAAAQQAGEKTVEEIAKELGVSKEEVQRAMEILGLSVMDLLNPTNLTMVVLAVSGETDPMALVTNADLSQSLKHLNQFVTDLRNELQAAFEIPTEQLDNMLAEAETVLEEEDMTFVETQEDNTVEESKTEQKAPTIVVETEDVPEDEVQTAKQSQNTESISELETDVLSKQSATDQEGSAKEQQGQNRNEMTGEQNLFFQNVAAKAAGTETVSAPSMPFAQQNTQEIMNQILEFMKIQIKPEMTQLEMQLHPESLGNVQVHLSAKEGVITAQFTAQNETVKAVLESQMVQLKETFSEQGVKVEAIEVSVQANGFRQEYEGSRNGDNEASQEQKKANRRINLNNPAAFEEEAMSEEEQLAVSMMEANGNTVDYTA